MFSNDDNDDYNDDDNDVSSSSKVLDGYLGAYAITKTSGESMTRYIYDCYKYNDEVESTMMMTIEPTSTMVMPMKTMMMTAAATETADGTTSLPEVGVKQKRYVSRMTIHFKIFSKEVSFLSSGSEGDNVL